MQRHLPGFDSALAHSRVLLLRRRVASLLAAGVGCALASVLACASGSPGAPMPGRATAWGYVKLVPRSELSAATGGAYGDRRLRDAELVDYSQPGFAVVYVANLPARTGVPVAGDARDVTLTIEPGTTGARIAPRNAALVRGDQVALWNRTDVEQLVSCPTVGVVRKVAPGTSLSFALAEPGEHAVHLLGAASGGASAHGSNVQTTLFVSPGPFATVSAAGRFVLEDLPPGAVELRSWHPRFPPRIERLDLRPGEVHRVDIEIGAGLDEIDEGGVTLGAD